MNDEDTDIARLRHALKSGDRHERAEAAVNLGQRGAGSFLKDIEALLEDPDDLVAVSATFACWRLGAINVPLDRAAASLASIDEEIVQLAVQALCEMDQEAVPQLACLLQANPPHAAQILRILGDIGGSEALETVQRIACSSDPDLAPVARDVLEDWEN